ncbi:MAG: stage II sporulation protein P [Clostridia bacterium]|nr:stage II sporulation protein P [Clostridia bacterium]
MKFIVSTLIMISLIFTGFKPVVFDGDYTESDSETYLEEVYENYQVFDESGNYITERTSIGLGDKIIDLDFNEYEVIFIDDVNFIAKVKFIQKLETPKVRRKEVSNVGTLQTGKSLGLYSTHNDESYIIGDNTESIYGKGGIHNIGRLLALKLSERNIDTYYDETLHIPHNSSAYTRSRSTAKRLLNDGATAIFDIHRDGTSRSFYLTSNNGKYYSKVRIVVGQSNPNKDANLQLALYLVSVAKRLYPWLIADIYYGSGRYNQDLSSKALLFEMGCHKIEKEYVERTIPYLADVIYTTLFETTVNENTGDITIGGATNTNQSTTIDEVMEDYQPKSHTTLIIIISATAISLAIIGGIVYKKRKKRLN